MGLSIRNEFKDTNVLLTGATGYLGGLVLEALLRTTAVQKVYVLLRRKGQQSPDERLSKLLQKNIFHKVRDQQQLLDKVCAIPGDITSPGLGLSPSTAQQLQSQLHFILHTAADIRLEVDIQSALRANYYGTAAVLELAQGCKQLRALVHTSSCFVNMNQPCSSVVDNKIYLLKLGDRTISCQEFVQDIMSLPPAAADVRAAALGQRWSFPNNYTLSKHLAEQLVAQAHQQGLPVCIVRPSLVCAVLYEPIPGHVGNWAGPIGASAALSLGFYHSLSCVSSQPLHVWDVMPADLVVNCILAAAAAVARDKARLIQWQAICQAAEAAGTDPQVDASNSSSSSSSSSSDMLILQSSSSSTYPMTLMEGWNAALDFLAVHPPKFRLSWGLPGRMTAAFRPNPAAVQWHRRWIAVKVWLACCLLRLFDMKAAAARLRNGFEALCVMVHGSGKTDKDLVFSAATLGILEGNLTAEEQQQYPLVMRPGMRLPQTVNRAAGEVASSETSPAGNSSGQQQQQQVLTWRRYFHTQMAAVYSSLFRVKVPRVAAARDPAGAAVEHDFVFVR